MAQIYKHGDITYSAWEVESGYLLIVSRRKKLRDDLIYLSYFKPRIGIKSFVEQLNKQIAEEPLQPMSGIEARLNLAPEHRHYITEHLLEVHTREGHYEPGKAPTAASDIAWRYLALTSWGEASAAKVLAGYLDVPVRTVHTRLKMARDRGLLSSPGSGTRIPQED